MMIFGLGALSFAALLGWLAFVELRAEKPTTWSGWAQYIGVISGIACTAIVAIRAMF